MTIDHSEWKPRLDYLASLEQGWCNGEGDPVSASVIATVGEFLEACSKEPGLVGDTRPALFPLVSSPGVQAEWEVDDVAWEIEFTELGATLCAFGSDEDFEVVVPAGEFLVERLVGAIDEIQGKL